MGETRATIKDVAALAEVSVATVSRVLSNADYPVSMELRTRVENAAKDLSFAYTVAPRQARGHDSREIALIIPNISNPFYMQTIQGISAVCYENGYQLVLCNTQQDAAREAHCLQELYNSKIYGVIISSIAESPNMLAGFAERGMVFIQLDQRFDDDGGGFNINYDSRHGARMAVRHLIENGHKRIAFASTPLTRWTRKEIYKGYIEQLKKADIEPDENLVFIRGNEGNGESENYEIPVGEALAAQLINSCCGATAVLCVNDMVAFGMIHGLYNLRVSVPDDISVMGFDDIPFSESFVPPLTTIHCPAYETGRISAMMLIDRLQSSNAAAATLNMHMQPTLVERRSVRNLYE
ncbi:MAG: LacI family DNA-binding transcriptional regulator [Oscillospiraceae bacterium]|nr:LacI family DNA-binding transcriptional regulator [Oscillospiraceae bacterium]